MESVNNFVTDLLDAMLAQGASNMLIISGSKPSLMANGVFRAVPGYDQIDREELVADLEALGISVDGEKKIPFTYVPDAPQEQQVFYIDYSHPLGKILLDITRKGTNIWAP